MQLKLLEERNENFQALICPNVKTLPLKSSSSLFTIYFYKLGIFHNNKVNFFKWVLKYIEI